MAGAVKAARAEQDRVGTLPGVIDEVLHGLVRLLVVDQQRDRIGHDARERDEVGARGLGRTVEQLIHLGVTGDAGVVRQQRVAVRLGAGSDLRADLAGGAGLGLDHHRLLQQRLHGGRERPRHDVVGAARRKRIDDGDRVRWVGVLRHR
jgi:hypothetical protein